MPLRALLSIYITALSVGLLGAVSLVSYGIFAELTKRNKRNTGAAAEVIRIFGLLTVESHGGPLGYIFAGIALLLVCLLFLSRLIPH